ncbi:MAG: ATP-dependent zinc metalloprotease FtsH [candidate division WS6 bacterium OLB20]|uniref:ATP-dependent zinc metalloprotease FtsH n=1 Tax=candidate division WS6 bacterium OLB20 TaxID=1617426 RepID=A0A136LYN4_9BACT|nr:MAG: ATP-dependent zinc metalloprotease FtsH [candidate division WS6 bacterium OLB20]
MADNSKIKRMPRVKRPSGIGFNFNTLFAVSIILLLVSVVFNMLNAPFQAVEVSVSEFVQSIKNNEYATVQIRDDGRAIARTKPLIGTELGESGIELEEADRVVRQENDGFETVSIDQLYESVRPLGIREIFSSITAPDKIHRVAAVYVGSEQIFARATDPAKKDLLVADAGEAEFEAFLNREGISAVELPVRVYYLRDSAGYRTPEEFAALSDADTFRNAWVFEDFAIAELKPEFVQEQFMNWQVINGLSLPEFLQAEGISFESETVTFSSAVIPRVPWGDLILLGMLFGLGVLVFFMFRGVQGSGNSLMKFGQSKARMIFGKRPDITFKDVAGVDEAKEELREVVLFLREPKRFLKLGARIPKGLLMVGPPGTGKTLLARAIAGEAGVPFFHTSGSEFEEMLVGAGASRVRDLFEKAKRAAPSIIFIDEIDAVARKRGTTVQSSTTEQTLNQILVEMDGFEKNTNVIVIAATNRPDVLDPAILRPGRFDRRVVLDVPDIEGRKQIIEIHAKNKPIDPKVDLEQIAKRTVGFSGADIENMLNEAAIIVAKDNRDLITFEDLEEAANKVQVGPAKKRKRDGDELKKTAYHEAGHALVMKLSPEHDPVHRVTIVSRGMALGYTMPLPEKDEVSMSRTKMLSKITALVAGYATEKMIYNDVTSGASNDIEKATSIARRMVKSFGMSDELGLVKYGQENELQYLGYGYGEQRDYSEESARLIDEEVRRIIDDCYKQAKQIIQENRPILDRIVDTLMEKEVIDSEEFNSFFKDAPEAKE